MKKYVKPDLYYENFELSQHVATCAWDMTNLRDKNSCYAVADEDIISGFGGTILFTEATGACEITESEYEDYCYTNGLSDNNVFNS